MPIKRVNMRMKMLVICIAGLALSACGETCESVEGEIMDITRDIRADPESAWDRAEELDALKNRLIEMDCLKVGS